MNVRDVTEGGQCAEHAQLPRSAPLPSLSHPHLVFKTQSPPRAAPDAGSADLGHQGAPWARPLKGSSWLCIQKPGGLSHVYFFFVFIQERGKKKIEERSTDQRCITCAPYVSPLYILRVSTHIKCSAVFSCEVTGSVKLLISNVRRGPDWLTGNNYDSFNLGGRLPGQCLQPGLESGSWWLQALWLTLRPAPTQRWASASSKSQMLGTLGPELGSGGLVSSPKTGCCQH